MLSTRHQWFTCVHLSVTYLIRFFPDLFLSCSRPWLLTTAAEGDLRPAPVSWSRGAFLFSLISCSVAHRATSSARSALVAHGESRRGFPLLRALRTGREPLSSYSSRYGTLTLAPISQCAHNLGSRTEMRFSQWAALRFQHGVLGNTKRFWL